MDTFARLAFGGGHGTGAGHAGGDGGRGGCGLGGGHTGHSLGGGGGGLVTSQGGCGGMVGKGPTPLSPPSSSVPLVVLSVMECRSSPTCMQPRLILSPNSPCPKLARSSAAGFTPTREKPTLRLPMLPTPTLSLP